ncbi:MAG TPA: hypothetical protein VK747_18040 [Blastocatellia bacterium]|nr:hypothetical protein [Blastocatellia bacterium]
MTENEKRYKGKKCRWLLILALLLFGSSAAKGTVHQRIAKVEDKLAIKVANFNNQDKPLIPTLLGIAADYQLPMGIERVVKEAAEQPITVKIEQGTVSNLLDRCIRQVPGYAWAIRDGAVHVYGVEELSQPSNLFNLVIPSFEVKNETLNQASNGLRMQLIFAQEKTGAVVASFPGSLALEDKQLNVKAHNVTVRDILNRLVALHGEAVWIARIPPQKLSHIPQAGLWQLLPRSVQDPKNIFEFN